MKAVLCKQFGPPESLVYEEMPSPTAGAGEVVVRVKAASLNFPDVLIIQSKYHESATANQRRAFLQCENGARHPTHQRHANEQSHQNAC